MTTSILKKSLLVCSCICTGLFAEAQFSFAPKIAVGLTTATLSEPPRQAGNPGTVKTTSNVNGNVSVGLQVNYQFDDLWALNSGVFYQYIQPTFNEAVPGTSLTTIITDKFNYINIPLEITHINDQLKKGWYYGIGVNFGLPISGTEDVAGSTDTKTTVKFDGEKNANDNNNTHYNFLNVGGTVKVGYFFNNMFIGIDGNYGFSNIAPNTSSKYNINTYGIHYGYFLGRKVKKPAPAVADTTAN
ncbi:MAG TPA: porin family protein [Ferruginibacter sp.]|jgi:hypothetical protein|nr:porin family protein [Ferruginibacter sp.]